MISFLRRFFFNSNLPNLKVGDIIWAKRYDTLEEMKEIEEGHRESPFIVFRISGKKVFGLQCTTSNPDTNLQLLREFVKKDNNGLDKDTYIFCGELILLTKDRYINTIGVLSNDILNNIKKRIYLLNKFYKKVKHVPKSYLKYQVSYGDIIDYQGSRYFILDVVDNKLITIQLNLSKNKDTSLKVNREYYGINTKGRKEIDKNEKYKLVNIANEDNRKYINGILNKKVDKEIRGTLISYKDELYYVYGEHENNLLLYKVYKSSDKSNDMEEIIIKRGKYYTKFEEGKISISSSYEKMRKATELEKDAIKKVRKSIKKPIKTDNKKINLKCKDINPGYIIIEDETLDKYLVLKRNVNNIIVESLEDNNYIEFEIDNNFNYSVLERMDKYKFKNHLEEYKKKSI